MIKQLGKFLFIFYFYFIFFSNAWAVTEFVSVYNKTGEDYSSMQAWEDAMDNAGDITNANCKVFSISGVTGTVSDGASVTGGTSGATATVIHVNSAGTQVLLDSISGTFQSGEGVGIDLSNYVTLSNAGDSAIITLHLYDDQGVMNESLIIDGLTTNTTNYWKITVPSGERHKGVAGTGAEIVYTGSAYAIRNLDDYTRLEYISMDCGSEICYLSHFNDSYVFHSIIHDSDCNTGLPCCFYVRGGQFGNNIAYNCGGNFEGCFYSDSGTAYFANNTCYNSHQGIYSNTGATTYVYNNAIHTYQAGDDDCFVGDFTGGSNNMSSDATADDDADIASGAIVSYDWSGDVVSTTTGKQNFHWLSGARAINRGDGSVVGAVLTIDVDGDSRPSDNSKWDIGADEHNSTSISNAVLNSATLN